jgi:hypothetical protein
MELSNNFLHPLEFRVFWYWLVLSSTADLSHDSKRGKVTMGEYFANISVISDRINSEIQRPERYESYLSNGTTHKTIRSELRRLRRFLPHDTYSKGVFRDFLHQFFSNRFAGTTPGRLLKMRIERYQGKNERRRIRFFTRHPSPHDSPLLHWHQCKLVPAALIPMEKTLRATYPTIPEGNLFLFEGGIACTVFYSCIFLILEYLHQVYRFWLDFFFFGLPLSPMFSRALDTEPGMYIRCKKHTIQ